MAPRSCVGTEEGAAGERATGRRPLRDRQTTTRLPRRAAVRRNRLDGQRGRTNMRDWANARRERTCHLTDRGRLVRKAGLVKPRHDRATLLGVWRPIVDTLHGAQDAGDDRHHIVTWWQYRAFDADRAALPLQPQVRRPEGI